MIRHEVLPRAAQAGLLTHRIGVAGESMGGYGALLLAEELGPAAIAAVAAVSPAIFASYADAIAANPASFDSPADFDRHNVQARAAALRHVPALVSVGADDPFAPETVLLRQRLARIAGHAPAGGVAAGCHDGAFFSRVLPEALAFASGPLALTR
jgi:acetyl esterase/lipase